MNVRHVEIASAHQLADVTFMLEQYLLFRDLNFLLVKSLLAVPHQFRKFIYFGLKNCRLTGRFRSLRSRAIERFLKFSQLRLCSGKFPISELSGIGSATIGVLVGFDRPSGTSV